MLKMTLIIILNTYKSYVTWTIYIKNKEMVNKLGAVVIKFVVVYLKIRVGFAK